MPKVTFVKKAQKDVPHSDIKAGESYYWWKFRYGGKHCSKTYPKRSQLTQSNFLSQLYDLEDELAEFTASDKDEFDSFRDEFVQKIEALRDECQEHLDSMPEQLQSAPTGELLQERIDALESWSSEIESVECEYDEEELKNEMICERADDELEELSEDQLKEELSENIQEIVNESIEEMQNCTHDL